jgi:P-type E1-E2 ATPase
LRRRSHPEHRGDLLLAVGVTVAYAAGLWQFSQHVRHAAGGEHIGPVEHGSAQVDVMLMLTFIALGKYLQLVALERTTAPLVSLLELPPEATLCVREGQQVVVSTQAVAAGETILVRPGQRVPLDARILSGSSQIVQSWLTGDARPVDCGPDAEIFAGTLNVSHPLIARVVHPARQSLPQRVADALQSAAGPPSRSEMAADRLANWLLPLAALAAAGAGSISAIHYGWFEGLAVGAAVYLSASASALALAGATAMRVGCGHGALHGVLILGGAAAETAAAAVTAVLDKKAAITPGLPAVAQLVTAPGVRPDELLATAAAAAQFGDDPSSSSIVAEAKRRKLRIPVARNQSDRTEPYQGIVARTLTGETIVGDIAWVATAGVDVQSLAARLAAIRAAGQSAVVVAVGTRLFGAIALAETVAPYCRQAVGQIRALGLRVALLSSEPVAVTAAAGREVRFDQVLAEIPSGQEGAAVRQLCNTSDCVAYVGAAQGHEAAMQGADLGVALGTAGTVNVAGANVVLPGDLRGVGRAILLSRAMTRTARVNLAIALAYNALAIPLFALFHWPGMLAAAASAAAGVIVVVNSLLLVRQRID